ncbi:hypothetical protein J0X12_08235 [Sneathiella sp. CAU 1612]|uniref:Uncharacterized protein n=1 Tax=Sneathiella sedimenti TaxID=2816034 RepID=A0ABS3F6L8_9PROT|nr:hypothetical protein [Sneathiella sedimenti]MBO0333597.1 hypothetical protein [Sneathiella sedimenti]
MGWLKAIVFLVLGILIGALSMTFDFEFVGSHMPGTTNVEFGFAELASVGLTAATVVLGCVALIVGIAAVFGYQSIRSASVNSAEKIAGEKLDGSLDEKVDLAILERLGPRIQELIDNAGKGGKLDEAFAKALYGTTIEEELDEGFDPNDKEIR